MEGHTIALQEKGSALIVALDRMDNIIEVNEMNGDAVVQAVSKGRVHPRCLVNHFHIGRRLGGLERASLRLENTPLLSD